MHTYLNHGIFWILQIDDQISLLINAWCELLVFSCCFRSIGTPVSHDTYFLFWWNVCFHKYFFASFRELFASQMKILSIWPKQRPLASTNGLRKCSISRNNCDVSKLIITNMSAWRSLSFLPQVIASFLDLLKNVTKYLECRTV